LKNISYYVNPADPTTIQWIEELN